MSGCPTCGGFGDRHDEIAHGAEPGEDLCLECHHPDHGKAECVAVCGVFYTDDGEQDDICDCTGARVYDVGGLLVSGAVWISNDSGEDEEVTPWPY